jgi:predicted neuraminidase
VTPRDARAHTTGAMAHGLRWRDLPAPTIQCHAANLMPLGDGSLGCAWFGGTQEGMADVSIWFSKRVGGDGAWRTPVKLSDDATRSEQNPILFPAPDGSLWLLHTAQRSGNQDTALVRCRVSHDHGATWGPTRDLFTQAGIFVRQPVVVLTKGEHQGDWLVPIFHCTVDAGERWSGDHDTSAVMISSDQGRTWTEHAVPGSTGCVHMNVLLTKHGLVAFYRSRWADHVWRSTSSDHGRTWTVPQPTPLPNNNSSIQVTRLASGALAIVFNDISAAQATERRVSLYDEIEDEAGSAAHAPPPASGHTAPGPGPRQAFWGTPRAPMTIALSDDDGLTWPAQRDLETGDGYAMTNNSADKRNRELSYPTVTQTADGTIHVAYTHHRQCIRHVETTEDWIRQR